MKRFTAETSAMLKLYVEIAVKKNSNGEVSNYSEGGKGKIVKDIKQSE